MGSADIAHWTNSSKEDFNVSMLRIPEASKEECDAAVGRRSTFSSGFEGVSLHAASGKWQAKTKIGDDVTYLGSFENETDAALACDRHAPDKHPS